MKKQFVLYLADIMEYSGKGATAARATMSKIRLHCKKGKGDEITIIDYCNYQKMTLQSYFEMLALFRKDKPNKGE